MISIAYAAEITLKGLVGKIIVLFVNPFIIFLSALAFLLFLWGMYQFLQDSGNEEARTVGKSHMIYGLLGLLIMVSAYGIMNIIVNTFNFKKPPEKIELENKVGADKTIDLEKQKGKAYDFKKN